MSQQVPQPELYLPNDAQVHVAWQNGENTQNVDLGVCLYTADGRLVDVCCLTKPSISTAFTHTAHPLPSTASISAAAGEEHKETIRISSSAVAENVALLLFVVCIRNEKKKALSKLFTRFYFSCDEADFRHDFLATKTKNKSFCPIVCRRDAASRPFRLLPTLALGNVDCCKKAGLENIWPLCSLILKQFLAPTVWNAQNSVDPLRLANNQAAFLTMTVQQEPIANDDEEKEEEKEDEVEKKIFFGLGWESRCDVDAHCYQVRSDGTLHDHIYFGKKDSKDKSTRLDKDDLTGSGPRRGDDERIYVDLNAVDKKVQYLCFAVQVYTSGRTFKDVEGEFIRIVDQKSGETLMRYELDQDDAFDEYNGAVVCVVKRFALSWQVEAVARPFDKEKSIEPILRNVLGIKH